MTISPWLSRCLTAAEVLRERSDGAFEPTAEPLMRLWGFYRRQGRLPASAELDSTLALLGHYRHDARTRELNKTRGHTAFDLGGIAKGFAVDRAVEALRHLGVGNALVDLGGNLYCLGGAGGKETWTVGIRDPEDRDRIFASVTISGRAVATSGSYERFVIIDGQRYGHIMNPATGRPAEGLLSATAIAPTATLADGLSTSLFVLGPENAQRILARHFPEVDAVLVLPAEGETPARIMATRGLRGNLHLRSEDENRFTVEYF